jgi:hypothetical protein
MFLSRRQSRPARTSGISYSRTTRFGRTLGFALSPGVCYRRSTPIECAVGAVLHPRRDTLRRVTFFWCAGPAPLACVICGATKCFVLRGCKQPAKVVYRLAGHRQQAWPVHVFWQCELISSERQASIPRHSAPDSASTVLTVQCLVQSF